MNILARFNRTDAAEPIRRQILLFCAAVWSCFSMAFLLSDAHIFAPLAVLFAPILYSFYRMCVKKADVLRIPAKLLCLLLACCSALALYLSAGVGRRFDSLVSGFAPFALRAFCIAGLALLLFALFCLFCVKCTEDDFAVFSAPLSVRGGFILWAILFVLWTILYFVCFYPGLFSSDTFAQLHIVDGSSAWTNHHPVLHTLLLYVTMRLSGYLPAVYVLVQILLTTALLAFTCFRLRKRRIWKWLWYAVVLYYLAHPIHSANAFSFIKDTLFSAAVLLFTLSIADLIPAGNGARASGSQTLMLAVSALLVLFLRNNGFVVVLLSLPILLLCARGNRLRVCIVGVLSLAVFGILQFVLFPKIGIMQTSIVESLGVPLQQMCSVIAGGKTFSADIMAYLERILPAEDIAASFDPAWVDPIKFHDHFDSAVISSDPGMFLRIWARGLAQHPFEYVKSYAMLTEFLWNPMQKAGMIESFTVSPNYAFTAPAPLIPIVSSLYIKLVNFSQFSQYAFLTRPFWNCALFYLTGCLCAVAVVQQKRPRLLAIWVPALSVWLSLMISTPISTCGRYAYSVFLCLPVFVALAAEKPDRTERETHPAPPAPEEEPEAQQPA